MIARTTPSTPSGQSQSILESYCSAASERNTAVEAFDVEVFRGLLTCFFAVEAALLGRTTLKRYLSTAYEHALPVVKAELASARTKINLSFDLWTSPNRRLSLLGVVAHYLDRRFTPRSILLGLPRMTGSHTAASLSKQLVSILDFYDLRKSFGYAVTDNASENRACLEIMAKELGFSAAQRHVRCMGHVINLVAQKVLFGSDVESFEHELDNVTAEAVELMTWRRKGPIEVAFESVEGDAFTPRPKQLIRDNLTRWNSWYDAAERAIELRQFIDEFIDDELRDYY
ncbi:hypothetical protein Q7P36_007062 [Cladosporium allicinum]